jgi:protein kinase A
MSESFNGFDSPLKSVSREPTGEYGFGAGGDTAGFDIDAFVDEATVSERHPHYGNIDVEPYRKSADTKRLKQNRLDFEKKLKDLQKRAAGAYKSEVTLGHLKIGRTLGEGNFGRVLVIEPSGVTPPIPLPNYAALKIQPKRIMAKNQKEMGHVREEKNLGFALDCPFLAKLIEYFQDSRSIYFLMELCNAGELWSIIQGSSKTRLNPKVATFWAAQCAMAFEYMHNLDVMFRDLKPENLLVSYQGHMKLTDFGFAKRCTDHAYTMCGTPEYMAPEILQGRGYTHDVDWWAFGILVYEMNWGVPPFEGQTQIQLFQKIQSGVVVYPPHFSKELKQMVGGFLTLNPSDRFSSNHHNGMKEIKGLPYFKGLNWDAIYAGKVKSPYKKVTKGQGDVSNFDQYEEQPVKWHGTGPDAFGDTFLGF